MEHDINEMATASGKLLFNRVNNVSGLGIPYGFKSSTRLSSTWTKLSMSLSPFAGDNWRVCHVICWPMMRMDRRDPEVKTRWNQAMICHVVHRRNSEILGRRFRGGPRTRRARRLWWFLWFHWAEWWVASVALVVLSGGMIPPLQYPGFSESTVSDRGHGPGTDTNKR